MNFKKWLKEEKGGGGIGVFLILIIIAAAYYAIEFGSPNSRINNINNINETEDLNDPAPLYSEGNLISSDEGYYAANPEVPENLNTAHQPINEAPEKSKPLPADSLAENRNDAAPPEHKPVVTHEAEKRTGVSAVSKSKSKPKAKPKRKRLSYEDLVKRKLKQGKTVKQIADETGLDKKYIREVKRRTQQVVW